MAREQRFILHSTSKSPRRDWPQRTARIIVSFLRGENYSCWENSFQLLDVFSFIQLNPSLRGKLFPVISFNVVTVKILSLKSGPLGFTTMLTEQCEGKAGGPRDHEPGAPGCRAGPASLTAGRSLWAVWPSWALVLGWWNGHDTLLVSSSYIMGQLWR